MKRAVIFVHRWLGVALALFFLLWFPSGIGMMYWDFPSVTDADRLARSPALDPSTILLSPADAYARLGAAQPPAQVRLNTFDERPAYRFRTGREDTLIYADTGEPRGAISADAMRRVAAAWTKQPAAAAVVEPIDVDQWTVQGSFRRQQPLWKYSWPNGEQVYVSQSSGEVVQYTTTMSRIQAYLGPIPHWLYFTPLRAHQAQWNAVVIWSSGIGTVTAILGIVIGIWMYSPAKTYRLAGGPSSMPYRGWKRWHMIVGLIFGIGAATWAYSGMLSMDVWPIRQVEGAPAAAAQAIPQALRGRVDLEAFRLRDPREALFELASQRVKELELISFDGRPTYIAVLEGGGTRIVPVDGTPSAEFDRARVIALVTKAAEARGGVDVRVVDRYDRYYLDRRHERPLPVVLAQLNDTEHTRLYIDPKTARVVGSYSSGRWASRWLYHGLHSLDFPWLYDHRPAWDIVMIAFMLGGTAVSVTSIVLAWRVLGRKLS